MAFADDPKIKTAEIAVFDLRTGSKTTFDLLVLPETGHELSDSSSFLRLRREFIQRQLLEPGSGK